MSKTPKPKKPETTVIALRVDVGLKAAIERAAQKKEWSVSHWLGAAAKAMLGRK